LSLFRHRVPPGLPGDGTFRSGRPETSGWIPARPAPRTRSGRRPRWPPMNGWTSDRVEAKADAGW